MKFNLNGLRTALPALVLIAGVIPATLYATQSEPDVIHLQGAQAQAALQEYTAQAKKSPTDFNAYKSVGILLHQLNRSTPKKETVEESEKYLKQATQLNPKDPEALAWLGSTITMKAMFETDPGKQTFYVKLGARNMDNAIQQAPQNPIVRLIRAGNSMALPPFLKRTRFAVEDYQQYLLICEKQSCRPDEVEQAKKNLKTAQQITAESM